MRLLIVLLLFIVNAYTAPLWYLNVKAHSSYELIGFGEGKTLKEAKLSAKDDIAKQIQTSVSSFSQKDVALHNDDLDKSFSSKIVEKSDVNLQDIKILKSEKDDAFFYVALSYENLPFETRFTRNVKKVNCHDEKQNPYLASTHLFAKLNEDIGCKLNIKLLRKDSMWYLTYKDYMQIMPIHIFEKLFSSVANKHFSFTPSSSKLTEGDEFYFHFKASKTGYVSLFDIYEDGTVSILFQNRKVFKNIEIQIPNKENEYVFEAGLFKDGRATYDIFLVVYTPTSLNLSRFSKADESLVVGESNKKFDEFLNFIKNKEFASVLLRTKPKK